MVVQGHAADQAVGDVRDRNNFLRETGETFTPNLYTE